MMRNKIRGNYRVENLKQSARQSAKARGHKMTNFQRIVETSRYESICAVCAMYVIVDSNPPANGIDIGGTAVALNCTPTV